MSAPEGDISNEQSAVLHSVKRDHSIFRSVSSFTPNSDRNETLNTYISTVTNEIIERCSKVSHENFRTNLSKEERVAIRTVEQKRNVVIKDADKGSAIVVMDRERYINEALRHLSDDQCYSRLDSDPTQEYVSELKVLVGRLHSENVLNKDQAKFAIPSVCRTARFYILPKIHKCGVPGRPVCSSNSSLTENISIIVDWFLKPLLPTIPSYIKDTNEFLRRLRGLGQLPSNALLVTLDVVALYPSIPHDGGLDALSGFLRENHFSDVVTRGILDLARFVLTRNYFEFDGHLYIQKSGTAIGTVMAVVYAVIYMHKFEVDAIAAQPLKPFVWWRFIDDIFAVWTHGETELLRFVAHLNSVNPRIKFTLQYSPASVNFLDVCVSSDQTGILSTDLHVKSTDTHQFLHSDSCHPNHTKKGIAYAQALRIKRICSAPDTAKLRCSQLEDYLVLRGHSRHRVRLSIDRALNAEVAPNPTLSLHEPRRIPLLLTYHPGLPDIKSILRELHPILMNSDFLKEIFPVPPMLSFRRPKNLREKLVRAKLPPVDSVEVEKDYCSPCHGRANCMLCSALPYQNSIISFSTGQSFRLYCGKGANCHSVNVVYCLTCTLCGVQYVGCTTKLRSRINNHRSCIRLGRVPRDCHRLYEHFAAAGHNEKSFRVTILDITAPSSLEDHEEVWIDRLRTVYPAGLNVNLRSNINRF